MKLGYQGDKQASSRPLMFCWTKKLLINSKQNFVVFLNEKVSSETSASLVSYKNQNTFAMFLMKKNQLELNKGCL